jgi:hypothetical protein
MLNQASFSKIFACAALLQDQRNGYLSVMNYCASVPHAYELFVTGYRVPYKNKLIIWVVILVSFV